jgi:hypothetical protein
MGRFNHDEMKKRPKNLFHSGDIIFALMSLSGKKSLHVVDPMKLLML